MEIIRKPLVVSIELLLKGRLDTATAGILENELSQVMNEGVTVVSLNMAEVEYLSSAGLRVIIAAYKRLSTAEGGLKIVKPSPPVQMVLDLSGMQDLTLD